MTITTHHPLAIVGGGLGGLTLARVLHVHGLDAAVFDLEAGRTSGPRAGCSTSTTTPDNSPCAPPSCPRSSRS
ncbi:FAD-dependent monooxygenase [Kitasatospora cheerisanensis]|uniref:FAD-dependent monooxygenase n=1 Tax=Kitasatospora cheerisanensis TaxID=81942 RepID=UPI000A93F72F